MEDAKALAEELEEITLQLCSLNALAEEPTEIAATTNSVIAFYEHLGMTVAMFDMEGVRQTAEWIHGMLTPFQASLPEAILELLQGGQLFSWIELAAMVLREPEELSHLSDLSATLMSDDWPEPLPPDLLERLLIDLRTAASLAYTKSKGKNETSADTVDSNILAWDANVHPELLDAYLRETPAQIAQAAEQIRLIAKGAGTTEQKRQAARLAHTIKGASGVVGVRPIVTFTHRLEDILELDVGSYLSNGLGEMLEATADCLETLFDHLQESKPLPSEYSALLVEMEEWKLHIAKEYSDEGADSEAEIVGVWTQNPVNLPDFITQSDIDEEDTGDEETQTTTGMPPNSSPLLSVPSETIQRLLNLAGELITSTTQIADHVKSVIGLDKQLLKQEENSRQMLDELSKNIDQQSDSLCGKASLRTVASNFTADFDQLELEAYNDLHSVYGLLAESIADNREFTRNLQQQIRKISDQVYQQQRLQRQLSETILHSRLVPVHSIVARMERTVRETCRLTGKKAKIVVHGQELQIDTDILNGLTPPLLHMLRNAIDHGIECPEDRESADKPLEGRIELRFEQKDGQIHMSLSDDGRGLDTKAIRARAVERGLITSGQELSEEDTLCLILQPGFTTCDQASEISGRGVGMDVVRSTVENLQGLLHLNSTLGEGSSIHVQVPLTLIATNALLVRVASNLVAIPVSTIKQVLYVSADEHIQDGERWSIQHQDKKLEVMQLARLLGLGRSVPAVDLPVVGPFP